MVRAGLGILFIVFQVLLALFLAWSLKIPKRYAVWMVAVFLIFCIPVPYVLWLQGGARQPPLLLAALVVRPFFAWNFNWICFLIFVAPVLVICRLVAGAAGWDAIITVIRFSVVILAVFSGAMTIYGLIDINRTPVVEKIEVEIKGLPVSYNGIKAVQLSDPHVAWWNSKEEVCEMGDLIRDIDPDLLFITGDMVDHNPAYVHALADCLDDVRPRLGRFAIIGNHDVYTGKERIAELMEQRGFRMLRNQCVSLEDKGVPLAVAGFEDSGIGWTGADPHEKDIPHILQGCRPGLPIILLAHRPSAFESVKGLPVALTLAGHTHGGQLKLPFNGPGLADITFNHPAGMVTNGGQTLYVSRGTGTVGWPFRLNCPAEITLISLKSPDG